MAGHELQDQHSDEDFSRLQEVQRALGLPELTDTELKHVAHGAELLEKVLVSDLGLDWPYDWSYDSLECRIARGLSVEAINAWNSCRRKRDTYGGKRFNPIGRKPIRHDELQPRLDDPFSMTKPLCIVARYPQRAYPLDRLEDWRLVYPEPKFWAECGCYVGISANCHKSFVLNRMSLQRGEFITVHNICGACNRWPFAYSEQQVEFARKCEWLKMEDHSIEPTNEDRKAQLLSIADNGVL